MASPAFVAPPNSNDIAGPNRASLHRPETRRWALKDSGASAALENGLQLAGLEAGARPATDRVIFFGSRAGDPSGLRAGGGRKGGQPPPSSRQDAVRRFLWCTAKTTASGPLLKLENLGDQRRNPPDYLVVQYRRRHPAGGGRPARSLGRFTRASQRRPTRFSTCNGRGGLEPGQRNGPSPRTVPRWRSPYLVKLYAERHQGPGSPSRRWPPGSWSLEEFLPLRDHPDQSKAIGG